jgi:hypothetical protein
LGPLEDQAAAIHQCLHAAEQGRTIGALEHRLDLRHRPRRRRHRRPGERRQFAAGLPIGWERIGEDKRVANPVRESVTGSGQQTKAKSAGLTEVVRHLHDGDVTKAKRLGEYAGGTSDACRAFAEAGTKAFRQRDPLVEKTGGASEGPSPVGVSGENGLFNDDIRHEGISPQRHKAHKGITKEDKKKKSDQLFAIYFSSSLCVFFVSFVPLW